MDLGEAKCRPNSVSKRLERDFEELLDDGRCLHRTGFHYIIDKVNHSALHWDMVCDLRRWGEVWVDNTLFLKDGEIVV